MSHKVIRKRTTLEYVHDILVAISNCENTTQFAAKAKLDHKYVQEIIKDYLLWGLLIKNDKFYRLTDEGNKLKSILTNAKMNIQTCMD